LLITKKKTFMMLFFPLLLAAVASIFHKYPLVLRLFLFAMPIFIIFIAYGVQSLFGAAKKFVPRIIYFPIVIIVLSVLFWGPVSKSYFYFLRPTRVEEIRPAIEHYIKNRKAGDILYVYYAAQPAFKYYLPNYNILSKEYTIGPFSRDNWDGYVEHIKKIKGKSRVWFLFSHVYPHPSRGLIVYNEEAYIREYLEKEAKRLDYLPKYGAAIYLYKMNP